MFSIHAPLQGSITLDNKEFFFLAGIMGSDHLLGVEDPFQDYHIEDLGKEWQTAKTSLLQKGYLIKEKNEAQFSMPPAIFSRVANACLADRACWMKYTVHGVTYESYLHVTNERIVQVCRDSKHPTHYMLDDLGNIEEACCKIMGDLDMQVASQSDMPALILSQQHFNELYEKSHVLDVDVLRDRLTEETNDIEGSNSLAKCLRFRSGEGEFHLSVWTGEEWETQQAALLIEDSVNWLFRKSLKSDEDWLVATPTSKNQFQNMLFMWLKQSSQSDVR